jgi:NDP-sugar pyrophosphorylase family protein
MDMARKFIQMGYTRARRYANHKGGKKYDEKRELLPFELNEEKAASAAIFKGYWDQIRADKDYLQRKKQHQKEFG